MERRAPLSLHQRQPLHDDPYLWRKVGVLAQLLAAVVTQRVPARQHHQLFWERLVTHGALGRVGGRWVGRAALFAPRRLEAGQVPQRAERLGQFRICCHLVARQLLHSPLSFQRLAEKAHCASFTSSRRRGVRGEAPLS